MPDFSVLSSGLQVLTVTPSGSAGVVLNDNFTLLNNAVSASTSVVSAATTTTLTNESTRIQVLTGSTTQIFQLPNATTLALGWTFEFNNNSSGTLTVKDSASSTITTVPAGGYAVVSATGIGSSAGTWDYYFTNPTSPAVTPVTVANGGTGLTTLTAHGVVLGEGTSNVAFATIGTAGRALIDQGAGADPAFEAISGDATLASSGAMTVAKVNGVAYGTSPSTNTVPVVTGANTVTYEAVPNAALANASLTVSAGTGLSGGGSVALGGSTTINLSTVTPALGGTGLTTLTAHGVLLGQATSNVAFATVGTAGKVLTDNGSGADPSFKTPAQQARITFDGNGAAITGVPLVWYVCEFAGTITGYTLLADLVGDIVIDVKKTDYSGFPGSFASITGAGTKPTLSASQKSQDSTLTSWSTSVSVGDILQFQINSVDTVRHVQLFVNFSGV